MAAKTNNATKLILKVYKDDKNDPKTALQRTFTRINPSLGDDAVYSIGKKLAALQSHGLLSISRADSAVLAE